MPSDADQSSSKWDTDQVIESKSGVVESLIAHFLLCGKNLGESSAKYDPDQVIGTVYMSVLYKLGHLI